VLFREALGEDREQGVLPHLLNLQEKIEAKSETDERECPYIVSGNTLKMRKEKPSRACWSPDARDVKFRSGFCVIPASHLSPIKDGS
jgi:hypothetical protein